MFRSKWKGALAVGVTVTGLGIAWVKAGPATPPAAAPAERTVVLTENGKGIRCRVVQSWVLPSGAKAHQLQAVESNEYITVVGGPAGAGAAKGKAPAQRVYHWGLGKRTPPAGCPVAPAATAAAPTKDAGAWKSVEQAGYKAPAVVTPPPREFTTAKPAESSTSRTLAISNLPTKATDEKRVTAAIPAKQTSPKAPDITAANGPVVTAAPSKDAVTPQTIEVAAPKLAKQPSLPPVPAAPVAPPTSAETAVKLPLVPTADRPTPPAAPKVSTERVVTLTENGKGTRCRVVQVWTTPAGTKARHLQAIDSGEYLTVVDEPSGAVAQGQGAPQRIYHWGLGNRTPPAGSPVPPTAVAAAPTNAAATPKSVEPASAKVPAVKTAAAQGAPEAPRTLPAVTTGSKSPVATPKVDNGHVVIREEVISGPTVVKGPVDCNTGCEPTCDPRLMSWRTGRLASLFGKSASPPECPPVTATLPAEPRPARPSSAQPMPSELPPAPIKLDASKVLSKSSEKPARPVAAPAPAPVAKAEPAAPQSTLPPGAQSVLAARSGLDGPIAYVPVPLVTVPKPWRPPVPPAPRVPDAPEPTAFVNAFTPPPNPMPKGMIGGMQQPMSPQHALMMQHQAQMHYAMMQQAVMRGQHPYQAQAAMMQGYMPAAMNPYMQPMAQGMPYGYPMPTQQQLYPAQFQRSYNGPQPPNPFGTQAPQMPMMPGGLQPISYTVPPAAAGLIAPAQAQAHVEQLVTVLRDSSFPSERERAANLLATFDWRASPHVLPTLVFGATQDPAGSVRACCVYHLGRMNTGVPQVRQTFEALRTDSDPRVRDQAEQALARTGGVTTAN